MSQTYTILMYVCDMKVPIDVCVRAAASMHVAVCCSVLQCVAVRCHVLPNGGVLPCVAVCCNVLQCVAVCCSVL